MGNLSNHSLRAVGGNQNAERKPTQARGKTCSIGENLLYQKRPRTCLLWATMLTNDKLIALWQTHSSINYVTQFYLKRSHCLSDLNMKLSCLQSNTEVSTVFTKKKKASGLEALIMEKEQQYLLDMMISVSCRIHIISNCALYASTKWV